jgi:hypothetical protein
LLTDSQVEDECLRAHERLKRQRLELQAEREKRAAAQERKEARQEERERRRFEMMMEVQKSFSQIATMLTMRMAKEMGLPLPNAAPTAHLATVEETSTDEEIDVRVCDITVLTFCVISDILTRYTMTHMLTKSPLPPDQKYQKTTWKWRRSIGGVRRM